jgi:hypothetical protein
LEEERRPPGAASLGFEKGRAARLEQIRALTRWLLQEPGKSRLGAGDNAVMRVVVDLTPLLPGGENGGAKPMTLELIRRMASRSPETKFILLTLRRSFDELAAFKQPNVEVVEVVDEAASLDPYAAHLVRTRRGLERPARTFWSKLRWWIPDRASPVRDLGGNVLFCPLTAPFFAQAGIPTVSSTSRSRAGHKDTKISRKLAADQTGLYAFRTSFGTACLRNQACPRSV